MEMSRIAAARGRGEGVEGRKGGRWRQRRTGREKAGSKILLQRVWSSSRMRRVTRFRRPYRVERWERWAWWRM